MELENIVANTVYLKAREGGPDNNKGRSKKWRKLMTFPHISQCIYLKDHLPSLDYSYLVDEQPVGAKLFRQFCEAHKKEYFYYNEFLDSIDSYEIEPEDSRGKMAAVIFKKYLTRSGSLFIDRMDEDTVKRVGDKLDSGERDLFAPCVKDVKALLSKEPFKEFLSSMYFHRYLQWKWLERQPVTYKTFRMYRVLGKGGFGEVCACQSRISGKLYACKKLEKKRIKKRKGESMVLSEKLILQKINSLFVVNLAYAFETKEALSLVLTIMTGGDLKFHIYNMGGDPGFSESRSKFYAAEILLGLDHLHSNGIVYRFSKFSDFQNSQIFKILRFSKFSDFQNSQIFKILRFSKFYDFFKILRFLKFHFSKFLDFQTFLTFARAYSLKSFKLFFDRKVRKCRKKVRYLLGEDIGCSDLFAIFGRHGAKEVMTNSWFSDTNWRRMKAGKERPPFIPDPHAVYAKDVLDIEQFSTVKGVSLDSTDSSFYNRFNTGAVSIP
eukprot:02543.XXX_34655_29217_1 [CDS] Oithona nana genome sequencing.